MKDWFRNRSPLEQLTIGLGAGALVLVILWLLVWEPVSQERHKFQTKVEREQVVLLQLQQLASEADRLAEAGDTGNSEARGDQSLLSLADRTVRAAGLAGALRRIEPEGENRVRLWLQQAPFDTMVSWLQSLAADYGIQVLSASINAGDSTGLVVADITLNDAP